RRIAQPGNANPNTPRRVVKDINDAGGILGRPIALFIADTASNESVAVANVRRLIQRDQVDVVLGGITSSMRNAIKDIIVTRGKTLYIYPEQYEGKECTNYILCTGRTLSQQCDRFSPWLIKNGGKRFALPAANYVFPRAVNEHARELIKNNGGEVIFEEYYPVDQIEYGAAVSRIMTNNVEVVLNTIIPPGAGPFLKQLHEAGFGRRGGRLACLYYDEASLNINEPQGIEGMANCLDSFRAAECEHPASARIQAEYDREFPGRTLFAAGTGATGMYRGLKLWELAVKEAGNLDREHVAAALDHAKISEGPGGPAEMVPGKRHCKMNMYTAV